MRLLPLCWLLGMTPALAAPVQLKLLEWGYLAAGYEQQFADYAKAHGVEATVSRIEPLLTDFDSVYRALRTRSADVVLPTSYFYKAHHQPLFKLLLAVAQASGRAKGLGDAAVARMREDLVFDIEPAKRDLGYAPRAFVPSAGMFKPLL